MKLLLKILFFVFTMLFTTLGEIKFATVVNVLQDEISDLFYQELQENNVVFENYFVRRCLNGEKVVTCGGRAENVEGRAAKGGTNVGKNVFTVTKEGVALPKGAKIPSEYVPHSARSSKFGVYENGGFVEKLRIDQATPPGFKGPNRSHFHLNNGGHIFDASKWPWWY